MEARQLSQHLEPLLARVQERKHFLQADDVKLRHDRPRELEHAQVLVRACFLEGHIRARQHIHVLRQDANFVRGVGAALLFPFFAQLVFLGLVVVVMRHAIDFIEPLLGVCRNPIGNLHVLLQHLYLKAII